MVSLTVNCCRDEAELRILILDILDRHVAGANRASWSWRLCRTESVRSKVELQGINSQKVPRGVLPCPSIPRLRTGEKDILGVLEVLGPDFSNFVVSSLTKIIDRK